MQRSFLLRGSQSELGAFLLDIRAARKTVRIKESERGLVGVQLVSITGAEYAPLARIFSAHWFQRVSSFFVRAIHFLIFIAYALGMYVDDFLLWQDARVLDLSACLELAFCAAFGVPISWAKVQLRPTVIWIGWQFMFRAGAVRLPDEKIQKLRAALSKVLSGSSCSKYDLDALLGLLQWVLQICPELRPWLSSLYADLHKPLGASYSIDPGMWQSLSSSLTDDMHFHRAPAGTAIPVGARLLSARHVDLRCRDDLAKAPLTSKRVWMRVSDARSVKREPSDHSRRFLKFWQQWATSAPCLRRDVECVLAADAFAHGSQIGIGGFLQFPGSDPLWFSERFCLRDFAKLRLPLDPEAQRNITCWEAMAQLGLVLLFSESVPGGRMRVCIPSFSDNTGAEASCNKLLTTSSPLCFFTQQLALVSWRRGVFLDVQVSKMGMLIISRAGMALNR